MWTELAPGILNCHESKIGAGLRKHLQAVRKTPLSHYLADLAKYNPLPNPFCISLYILMCNSTFPFFLSWNSINRWEEGIGKTCDWVRRSIRRCRRRWDHQCLWRGEGSLRLGFIIRWVLENDFNPSSLKTPSTDFQGCSKFVVVCLSLSDISRLLHFCYIFIGCGVKPHVQRWGKIYLFNH